MVRIASAWLVVATTDRSITSVAATKPLGGARLLASTDMNITAPVVAMLQQNKEGQELPKDFFGDLTCMRWTGGTCSVMTCKSDRNSECEEGYCVCPPGFCANSEGVCDQFPGEWLGDHSLAFTNAYHEDTPYVQATSSLGGYWFDEGLREAQNAGVTHMLSATADAGKEWKLALTGHGHVRFESKSHPGHIMTIYHVRRRRSQSFLQTQGDAHPWKRRVGAHEEDPREHQLSRFRLASLTGEAPPPAPESLATFLAGSSTADRVQISDNDHLWPVLMRFEEAHPLDASFRVRHTLADGGGTEIWDPQHQVALSSADPAWTFRDRVAGSGVAECEAPGLIFGGECEGRQLVTFEPPLPHKAVVVGPRDEIFEVGSMSFFEILIGVVFLVACMAGCGFVGAKMEKAAGH